MQRAVYNVRRIGKPNLSRHSDYVGPVQGAIDSALAYNKCYVENSGERLSCFLNKV